jgi:crotonobetainyl-CoA:carnitine CoA-transferase CaiB-like acyl-CoA transferase
VTGEGRPAPLDGIRVLDLSQVVSGPICARVLADLGADVVKIEPLGGDPMRGKTRQPKLPDHPPVDESFHVDNRGKRSIAVALDTDEGATLVRRIVAGADVLVTNLLPHRQTRFGLTPDDLLAMQPRLVHATLSGYGLEGPDATRPGYDVTAFFGRGAISDSLAEPDGPPPHPRPAQGDHTTGLALVAAVLAALRLVDRTGEGQVIDVSLFATAAWTMATDLAPTLVDRRQPSRRGRHHLITPLANRFPCGDGKWVVFNMPEEHWWPRFCHAVGRDEWTVDERFQDTKGRFDHMPILVDGIDEALSMRSRDEWAEVFDEAGLIWGPANDLADLVGDPQAAAAGLWAELEHPEVGRFETVSTPIRIRGVDTSPASIGPSIGQHTDEVLAGLDLGEDERARLRRDGIVR